MPSSASSELVQWGPPNLPERATSLSFTAELIGILRGGGGGGAFVTLPDEAAKAFGTRARFPVWATFNGVAYRGFAMPMSHGCFALGVPRAIRRQLRIPIGATVAVVVTLDTDPRSVDVPAELHEALTGAGLMDAFEAMPYTHRREYARWVAEARKPQTRQRRIEQAVALIHVGKRRS